MSNSRSSHPSQRIRYTGFIIAVGLLLALTGCQSLSKSVRPKPSGPEWSAFYGVGGQETTWYTLKTRAQLADVVLIGEQHDNEMAHRLELKLFQAVLEKHPDCAVVMEMFERDEQALLDSYLKGEISVETLFEASGSAAWGGSEEAWRAWYLPVVDAAKSKQAFGASVIAGNAPRRYAVMARMEDTKTLQKLLDEMEKPLFALPDEAVNDSAYRQRFVDLMSGHGHGHGNGQPIDPAPYFRAQQLWDATLADSVLAATEDHARVILLVGDFHIAYDGGLVQRIRHANPALDILTISIQRKLDTSAFDPEDRDRANFVIYTRENARRFVTDTAPTVATPILTSPWERKTGPRSK